MENIQKFDEFVNEKWSKKVKIKKTNQYADKTIAELDEEMARLKGDKPFNREKYSELLFAKRAKQDWPKGKKKK
jgi:hypothetical protein